MFHDQVCSFKNASDQARCIAGVSELKNSLKTRRRRSLSVELLESRLPLDAAMDFQLPVPRWFGSVDDSIFERRDNMSPQLIGPQLAAPPYGEFTGEVYQWIVRINESTTQKIGSLSDAASFLDTDDTDFRVIRGLGLPGMLLVESRSQSGELAERSLALNNALEFYAHNDAIRTEKLASEFEGTADEETIASVSLPEAWDRSTGTSSVVVGVIDSGVDVTHPDLYLNIWINQGEIPTNIKSNVLDVDGDGRITFYDLNDSRNSNLVRQSNDNNYFDAQDLINDLRWSDGVDTDGNGFVDDFFGWNFRSSLDEPFAANYPSDSLGHGTHIAGVIGAVANNDTGIAGVNWRTSIMSLKFLDLNNQGSAADAIAAINYATMMRTQFGENVRATNNSWGQVGGFNPALSAAINASDAADITFVAAAGNGNIFGEGINTDLDDFYPAGYEKAISVAAIGRDGELAPFSNFGERSVDIAAPGIAIRSTVPNAEYATLSGTSFAAPFVTGTAALISAIIPNPTSDEVRAAIIDNATTLESLANLVAANGKLSVSAAIDASVFAPSASLSQPLANVVQPGGTAYEFEVIYRNGAGSSDAIDEVSLSDGDLHVERSWGTNEPIAVKLKSAKPLEDGSLSAIYSMTPPDGSWDPLDFGQYELFVAQDQVKSKSGKSVRAESIGSFKVEIQAPSVFYVKSFADDSSPDSLRNVIDRANKSTTAPATIILDTGFYSLSQTTVIDTTALFPFPGLASGCTSDVHSTTSTSSHNIPIGGPQEFPDLVEEPDPNAPVGWSSINTGDLNIIGQVTIFGNHADKSVIDAGGINRVFRVLPGASLSLHRLTVTGGTSPESEGGGGILSAGRLELNKTIVRDNVASGLKGNIGGGGIAVWGGTATILDSRITNNVADAGGGVYFCNGASGVISGTTIDSNEASDFGGGIGVIAGGAVEVTNSTLSANRASDGGAIVNRVSGTIERTLSLPSPSISGDGSTIVVPAITTNHPSSRVIVFDSNSAADSVVDLLGPLRLPSLLESFKTAASRDGRYIAFDTEEPLVPDDANGVRDVYLYDREATGNPVRRISVSTTGIVESFGSSSPSISADGRFIVFESDMTDFSNSDPIDPFSNPIPNVFLFDLETGDIERVSETESGVAGNSRSQSPAISADGTVIAYSSSSINIVSGSTEVSDQVLVYDRTTKETTRVSVSTSGEVGNNSSFNVSLSDDGKRIVFESYATNLLAAPQVGVNTPQIFLFDVETNELKQVSLNSQGASSANSSNNPSISGNGRFVVFNSRSGNLVPGDNNDQTDIFIRDLTQSTTTRVYEFATDELFKYDAVSPAIDSQGNNITFRLRPRNAGQQEKLILAKRSDTGFASENVWTATGSLSSLEHTTLFENSGRAQVLGNVDISNSMVHASESIVALDSGAQSVGGNLFSTRPNEITATDVVDPLLTSKVSSLVLVSGITPVHLLKTNSRAIDAAVSSEQFDQLGRRRTLPDIGATEAVGYNVSGSVFLDSNENGVRDAEESGQPDIVVYLDLNQNRVRDAAEPYVITSKDDVATNLREDGIYSFSSEGVIDHISIRIEPDDAFIQTNLPISMIARSAVTPSFSSDGRFIAFASKDDLLGTDHPHSLYSIYVYDRLNQSIEQVSPDDSIGYHSSIPVISGDGRYIAFESPDGSLVRESSETSVDISPGIHDIFLYDRVTKKLTIESVDSSGNQGGGASTRPSLSQNGRYLTFQSTVLLSEGTSPNSVTNVYRRNLDTGLTELVSINDPLIANNNFNGDSSVSADGRYVVFSSQDRVETNNQDTAISGNIYLLETADDGTQALRLISKNSNGQPANGVSRDPFITPSGKFIVFESTASDLVPEAAFLARRIYVYEMSSGKIELASLDNFGEPIGSSSANPMISDDGRFVIFESNAFRLTSDDESPNPDVYLRDRLLNSTELLSINRELPKDDSSFNFNSVISANGAYIGFNSNSPTLVRSDVNDSEDSFFTVNPFYFAELPPDPFTVPFLPLLGFVPSIELDLSSGEFISNANFGVSAKEGAISGTVFLDENANDVREVGEFGLADYQVFLDLNENGRLDRNEPIAYPDLSGFYEFSNVPPLRDYTIAIQRISSLQSSNPSRSQILPRVDDLNPQGTYRVFVPAAGRINGRDFGFRDVASVGQSVGEGTGRVFDDANSDGVQDPGERGLPGVRVFVDLDDDGLLDDNERFVNTDADGNYRIGLTNNRSTVRIEVPQQTMQTSPLTSGFVTKTLSQDNGASNASRLSDVSDVLIVDINGDGFSELVMTQPSINQLSLYLNDGSGMIEMNPIRIPFDATSAGPSSLIAGEDTGGKFTFLAVASDYTSSVTILSKFNGSAFDRRQVVSVPESAVDIESADVNDDGHMDLLVLGKRRNGVTVLLQNANGEFRATKSYATGGTIAGAMTIGKFNNDNFFDIVVANRESSSSVRGDVRILIGDREGGFTLSGVALTAGRNPSSITSADFNGDGHVDLAVANRGSQNISVFQGDGTGRFPTQLSPLGAGSVPVKVLGIDVENDGRVDLISTSGGTMPSISIIRNLSNSSSIQFAPQEQTSLGQFESLDLVTFAAGDLDNNGAQDLVLANGRRDLIEVRSNLKVIGPNYALISNQSTLADQLNFGVGVIVSSTLVPRNDGESIQLDAQSASQLLILVSVDLRGRAANRLVIDPSIVSQLPNQKSLDVFSDSDDLVSFINDSEWEFLAFEKVDNKVVRTFEFGANGAKVRLSGPWDLTNPLNRYDVNHDRRTTASDALAIINVLSRAPSELNEGKIDPAFSTAGFLFWDSNQDGRVTARDALVVINELNRNPEVSSGVQGELNLVPATHVSTQRIQVTDSGFRSDVEPGITTSNTRQSVSLVDTALIGGQRGPVPNSPHSQSIERESPELDEIDYVFRHWNWID